MANHVLAFAESRGGELRKVAYEAATVARSLANAAGGEAHVLLAGAPGIAAKAEALGRFGADVVVVVEHAALGDSNPEALAATIADRVKAGGYRAVVFVASAQGKDLAPRVAAKLGVPLASDLTTVELSGDKVVGTHPVNTGKVIATVTLTAIPAVVSMRPGAVTAAEAPRTACGSSAPTGCACQCRSLAPSAACSERSRRSVGARP